MEARCRAIAEWASEGEPNIVGEPELALRYQRSVCIGIRKEGAHAPSRVAPQDFLLSQQYVYCGTGFLFLQSLVPQGNLVQMQRKVD